VHKVNLTIWPDLTLTSAR